MTPEQFTKGRAEFIKACSKTQIEKLSGAVFDLDMLCDALLKHNSYLGEEILGLKSVIEAAIDELRSNGREMPHKMAEELTALAKKDADALGEKSHARLQAVINLGVLANRKAQTKEAINKRHNKEGGSRDAQAQLRAIWAQGNFSTRTDCAEQERGRFKGVKGKELSLNQAIKYLRNTPDPDPWPADPKRKGGNP